MINLILRNYLSMVPRKNSNWINNLQQRKIEEINFHNLDRKKKDDVIIQKQKDLDIHANRKFYSITNGTREFILNWVAINSKGKVFEFYTNGFLKARGSMKAGELHGYWEWFRKDGTIMRSGNFKSGQNVGEWITYDSSGKVYKVTQKQPRSPDLPIWIKISLKLSGSV